MTNSAKHPADFKCTLRAQGHLPQRMQVYRLGKNPAHKIYRIPNGRELVGKELWLDLEELNGLRTLKYRFVAGADAAVVPEGATSPGAGNTGSPKQDALPTPPNEARSPLASAKS
jgi:hypothetical protein